MDESAPIGSEMNPIFFARPAEFVTWLEEHHQLSPEELSRIEADVDGELAEAVAFAEASDWELVEELERFAIMDEVPA